MRSLERQAAARYISGSAQRGMLAMFARPADTTAYASSDVVAQSVNAGSCSAVSILVNNSINGGLIRAVNLRKSNNSLTNASFRVHFYSAAPSFTNGDNGVWLTSGAASYLGNCDVTIDRSMSDGAIGRGVPEEGTDIVFPGKQIWMVIEARGAYTPASAETFYLEPEVIVN